MRTARLETTRRAGDLPPALRGAQLDREARRPPRLGVTRRGFHGRARPARSSETSGVNSTPPPAPKLEVTPEALELVTEQLALMSNQIERLRELLGLGTAKEGEARRASSSGDEIPRLVGARSQRTAGSGAGAPSGSLGARPRRTAGARSARSGATGTATRPGSCPTPTTRPSTRSSPADPRYFGGGIGGSSSS